MEGGKKNKELVMNKAEEKRSPPPPPSKFKRICVFCGSSPGKKASYQEAAIELGKELVMI